ncbi:hypothetical protein Tco_1377089 [Tanacetum coccineum]
MVRLWWLYRHPTATTMVFLRLWWLIHHPQPATAAAGKAAAVVVVPAVVRRRGGREGGKGVCEGGAVREVILLEKYRRKRWRLAGKICRKSFPAAAAEN